MSTALKTVGNGKTLGKRIMEHWILYLFMLPCVISLLVFSYYPMYGATLAFKDYRFSLGIMGSRWIGFQHFIDFFTDVKFWNVLRNTVGISLLRTVFVFPAPIILALLLNELKYPGYKKAVQSFSYLPHFVSWVVVFNIMTLIFSPYGGLFNSIRNMLGLNSIFVMGEAKYFYPLLILSDIWKSIGWGSIIYLAAITGINPELYESAALDGAGRLKCCWHITLPSIKMTIGILFIMNMGNILNAGFDQVLLMQQPANMQISEILDTWVLRVGIKDGKFGFATAVGLFKSVIALIILLITNAAVKKTTEVSLF